MEVRDTGGLMNRTTRSVVIEKEEPVAAFSYSPSDPTTQDTVDFTDESYDIDGNIRSWTWRFGDGEVSYERNPSHQYEDDGDYEVELSIRDNDGLKGSVSKKITVLNVPPEIVSIEHSPADPTTLDVVEFTGNSEDPDGATGDWQWDFGDGSTSIEMNTSHEYEDNGAYTVQLTVTDDDGAVSNATAEVEVLSSSDQKGNKKENTGDIALVLLLVVILLIVVSGFLWLRMKRH